MKQTLLLTVMLLITRITFGQIGIISGVAPSSFTPPAVTGINIIYLCNGMGDVTLTFSGNTPVNITWSRYKNALSDAVVLKSESSVTASSITGLACQYNLEQV